MRFCIIFLTLFVAGCEYTPFNNKNVINLTLVCKNLWEPLELFNYENNEFIKQSPTQIIHVDVDLIKKEGSMIWETRGEKIPSHRKVQLAMISDNELTFFTKGPGPIVLDRRTLDVQASREYYECKKTDPI